MAGPAACPAQSRLTHTGRQLCIATPEITLIFARAGIVVSTATMSEAAIRSSRRRWRAALAARQRHVVEAAEFQA
jgi:hypothetical protein